MLLLDPQVKIKNDLKRAILFPRNSKEYSKKFIPNSFLNCDLLHPIFAIVLSMCDGQNTKQDVIEKLTSISGLNLEKCNVIVSETLKKFKNYVLEIDTSIKSIYEYKIEKFIINQDAIDLSYPRLFIPNYLVIALTNNCNRNCIYCYAAGDKNKESLKLIYLNKVIEEAADLEINEISLSGGDPLLYPDIVNVLKLIIEKNIRPLISTKQILQEKEIAKLSETGLKEIQLSIDSYDDVLNKKLIGVNGYFEKMKNSIEYYIKNGITINVNIVASGMNIKQLPGFLNILLEHNVSTISISQFRHQNSKFANDLVLNSEELSKVIVELDRIKNKNKETKIYYNFITSHDQLNKNREYYQNVSRCLAGKTGFAVLPNGNVTICENLGSNPNFIIGNVKDKRLMELWNSEKLEMLINPEPEKVKSRCGDCKEFNNCYKYGNKCWLRSIQCYNEPWEPDPLCPNSPEGKLIF